MPKDIWKLLTNGTEDNKNNFLPNITGILIEQQRQMTKQSSDFSEKTYQNALLINLVKEQTDEKEQVQFTLTFNTTTPEEKVIKQITSNGHKTGYEICKKQFNVYYLKVHKTGSSTFTNLLQRFGLRHNLTTATFRHYHPYPTTDMFKYLTHHQRYQTQNISVNLVTQHTVFNKAAIHKFMPHNTKFTATVRHPLNQLKSAFNHYNLPKLLHLPSSDDPVRLFLSDPERYDRLLPGSLYNPIARQNKIRLSFTRNRMAFEFGYDLSRIGNQSYVDEYLNYLAKEFDMVVITEHYDESLLLLKHQYCWSLLDILYLSKLNKTYNGKHTVPEDYGQLYENHKKWARLDYVIYYRFLDRFKSEREKLGDSFTKELAEFKEILKRLKEFCSKSCASVPDYTKQLQLNSEAKVSCQNCRQMSMSQQHLTRLMQMQTSF